MNVDVLPTLPLPAGRGVGFADGLADEPLASQPGTHGHGRLGAVEDAVLEPLASLPQRDLALIEVGLEPVESPVQDVLLLVVIEAVGAEDLADPVFEDTPAARVLRHEPVVVHVGVLGLELRLGLRQVAAGTFVGPRQRADASGTFEDQSPDEVVVPGVGDPLQIGICDPSRRRRICAGRLGVTTGDLPGGNDFGKRSVHLGRLQAHSAAPVERWL